MLLTHTPGFSEAYIPVTHLPNFLKPLTDLFNANAMALSYPELLQHCEELYNNYVITADQAEEHSGKSLIESVVPAEVWVCDS